MKTKRLLVKYLILLLIQSEWSKFCEISTSHESSLFTGHTSKANTHTALSLSKSNASAPISRRLIPYKFVLLFFPLMLRSQLFYRNRSKCVDRTTERINKEMINKKIVTRAFRERVKLNTVEMPPSERQLNPRWYKKCDFGALVYSQQPPFRAIRNGADFLV